MSERESGGNPGVREGREVPSRRIPAHIDATPLEPGLYLVATPIGAARDITLRALDVLNSAELLAAEDTRVMRHLMDIHGIPLRGRKIIAYHDHNAERRLPPILAALKEGKSVAYASDAGTPLVADPGFRLARDASVQGSRVHAVPGPSAALAALSLSGLPSDRFLFAGIPPATKSARSSWIRHWAAVDATVNLFENPRRVKHDVEELFEIEPNRIIVIARELTKKFEEVIRGTAAELLADPRLDSLKGEVVLVLDRPVPVPVDLGVVRVALERRLGTAKVKDAARQIADDFGLSRRDVYQLALEISDGATFDDEEG